MTVEEVTELEEKRLFNHSVRKMMVSKLKARGVPKSKLIITIIIIIIKVIAVAK